METNAETIGEPTQATSSHKPRAERKMFQEIKRIAEEAVLASRTNQQVADAVNAAYPDYEMQATDVASVRSRLRKAGNAVPTSAEAGWRQNFASGGAQLSSPPDLAAENAS